MLYYFRFSSEGRSKITLARVRKGLLSVTIVFISVPQTSRTVNHITIYCLFLVVRMCLLYNIKIKKYVLNIFTREQVRNRKRFFYFTTLRCENKVLSAIVGSEVNARLVVFIIFRLRFVPRRLLHRVVLCIIYYVSPSVEDTVRISSSERVYLCYVGTQLAGRKKKRQHVDNNIITACTIYTTLGIFRVSTAIPKIRKFYFNLILYRSRDLIRTVVPPPSQPVLISDNLMEYSIIVNNDDDLANRFATAPCMRARCSTLIYYNNILQ